MIRFPYLFGFALAAVLPGCALTPMRREQAARLARYEQLLATVQPGMTRKQLYALLPPKGVPVATPPHCHAIIGIALFMPLTETHPLDADFSLVTQYRLAQLREYPWPWSSPGTSAFFTIDDGRRGKLTRPSRQNPRDELLARPSLAGPGVKTVIHTEGDGSPESLVVDPRQLKFSKPQTAPLPKDYPRLSQ